MRRGGCSSPSCGSIANPRHNERASGEARALSAAPPSDVSGSEKPDADKIRAQKDAAERDADTRLTKQLMICRNC